MSELGSVQPSGGGVDLRLVFGDAVELLEVGIEAAIVGVPGPLRHLGQLVGHERRHLDEDVEVVALLTDWPGCGAVGAWRPTLLSV